VTSILHPILTFSGVCHPSLFLFLNWWDSSKIPKLYVKSEIRPLLEGFALDVNVSDDTSWLIQQFSGSLTPLFRFPWVWFLLSVCNKLTGLESVQSITLSMTVIDKFSHSWQYKHHDWFTGRNECRMLVKWCCMYLHLSVGHRIQSLQWIPHPFFTDNASQVVVRHHHPLFKGTSPDIGQWQPHYNFLSDQCAKYCRCHRAESVSMTL